MAKGQELPFRSTLDDSDFEAKMRRMEATGKQVAGRIGGHLQGLAKPISALGPAIAAAFTGGAIISGVKNVFDAAESLGDLSDQTGVSVGRLAVLGKAFHNAGLEVEDAGGSINRMQKFLAGLEKDGTGADVLERLGLHADELKKLRPEQQFVAIGNAITALRSPTERATTAMELFGKSGGRLLAAFSDPMFTAAGGPLTGKAALLERNAEIFARISIKLEKASGVLKTFYAGVAEGVAAPLDAILDRVTKVDLVTIGQQFGDALAKGAEALTPALDRLAKIDWSKISRQTGDIFGWIADDLSGGHDQAALKVANVAKGMAVTNVLPNPNGISAIQQELERSDRIEIARDTGIASTNLRPETRAKNDRPLTLPNPIGAEHQGMMTAMQGFNYAPRPLSAPSTPYSRGELMAMENEEKERQHAAQLASAKTPERIVISADDDDMGAAMDRYYSRFRSSHRLGMTGLDVDPTSGLGYTGARAGVEGFRRGLSGGAYGRTGNIWSQISGRVGGPVDPATDTAKNTAETAQHLRTLVSKLDSSGGGGAGGGGATASK